MKTIFKTLLCAGACVAMLASCQEEFPYQKVTPIDAPATAALSIDGIDGEIGLMAPKTKSYTISIKAGQVADDMLKFTIGVNPEKVSEYNAANGTSYELVPGDAYSISKNEFILPRYNTQSSTATLTLMASGMPDDGQTRLLPITITKIEGTPETALTASDSTVFIKFFRKSLAEVKFEEGSGTEADPYIVRDHADMLAMVNDLKSGETTYIRMEADVNMAELEEWMPVNAAEPYDKAVNFNGNGHVIKNLYSNAASMPSLFGVLKGSVHDVIFENCTIEPGTSNEGAGLIAGKAVDAEIKNIKVTGLNINSMTAANGSGKHIGGLVGITTNCTFKNIDAEVYVNDGNGDGKVTRIVGGLVGMTLAELTDNSSEIKAIADRTKNPTTFEDCHVKGSIFAYHYSGGLVGVVGVENTTITNCSAAVNMNFTTGGNYAGGFIGYANKGLKVTGCHATGNIDNAGNYKGGFIGGMQGNATISKCWSSGNVTNTTGTHVGAFIGNVGVGTADFNDKSMYGNTLIEDCYCTGNLTVTAGGGNSGRMNAGFIAIIEKATNVTVNRCYSSGDISAIGSNGPISGFIAMHKMTSIPEDMNGKVENCIAWNKKVTTSTTNGSTWSSGAIVGVSSNTNTNTNCYRRADMEWSEECGGEKFSLYDQEDSSPTAPLAYDSSKYGGYKCPYHGKAAPKGATCSEVAKSLGWPETTWDLSGDMPKLK